MQNVTVQYRSKIFPINIDSRKTVQDLKRVVAELTGIKINNFSIKQNFRFLIDTKPVSFYINNGISFSMENVIIKVIVNIEGNMSPFFVSEDIKISEFKEDIIKKSGHKGELLLYLNGKKLQDTKTVAEEEVENGSTLLSGLKDFKLNMTAFNTEPSRANLSTHFNNLTPTSKEVPQLETRSNNPSASFRLSFKDDMICRDRPSLSKSVTRQPPVVVPSMLRGKLHNSLKQRRPATLIEDIFYSSVRERQEPYQRTKDKSPVTTYIEKREDFMYGIQREEIDERIMGKTRTINKFQRLELQSNEENECFQNKSPVTTYIEKREDFKYGIQREESDERITDKTRTIDKFQRLELQNKERNECFQKNLPVKNRTNEDVINFDIQDSDKLDRVNGKTDNNEELNNKIQRLEMQNKEQNEILIKKQKAIDLMKKKIENNFVGESTVITSLRQQIELKDYEIQQMKMKFQEPQNEKKVAGESPVNKCLTRQIELKDNEIQQMTMKLHNYKEQLEQTYLQNEVLQKEVENLLKDNRILKKQVENDLQLTPTRTESNDLGYPEFWTKYMTF